MSFPEAGLLFLTPFPDGETVNSYLTRLPFYEGSVSLTQSSKRLLGRKVPMLDDMPCNLATFYREIGHLYGSMANLVCRHTSFDMNCCGLPTAVFSQQMAKLVGRLNGPVHLCQLPLLFMANEGGRWRCPECAVEQRAKFSFTYAHRRTGCPLCQQVPYPRHFASNSNARYQSLRRVLSGRTKCISATYGL